VKDLEALPSLELSPRDKGLEMSADFRFFAHPGNKNFVRVVIGPGDKVEESLVGVHGYLAADVRKHVA
jgi:hypothetical protein